MVTHDPTTPQTSSNQPSGKLGWGRIGLATLAGNVTFLLMMQLLYDINPLTRWLLFTEAAGQADKFLMVWVAEPQPAITPAGDGSLGARAFAVMALLLVWTLALVLVFARVRRVLPHGRIRRGVTFGVGSWAVVFIFYDVWAAFNAFHEPIYLTLYEWLLELIAMITASIVISGVVGKTRVAGDAAGGRVTPPADPDASDDQELLRPGSTGGSAG